MKDLFLQMYLCASSNLLLKSIKMEQILATLYTSAQFNLKNPIFKKTFMHVSTLKDNVFGTSKKKIVAEGKLLSSSVNFKSVCLTVFCKGESVA